MPGAMSNNPYYDDDELPDEIRDMMNEYHQEKKKIMPPNILLPKDQIEEDLKKQTMDEFQKQMDRMLKEKTNVSEAERVRREIQPQLDEIKEGMRKIGIILDSDLPDEESFKKFKMLREAYRKYKMVERLVLGQDDD